MFYLALSDFSLPYILLQSFKQLFTDSDRCWLASLQVIAGWNFLMLADAVDYFRLFFAIFFFCCSLFHQHHQVFVLCECYNRPLYRYQCHHLHLLLLQISRYCYHHLTLLLWMSPLSLHIFCFESWVYVWQEAKLFVIAMMDRNCLMCRIEVSWCPYRFSHEHLLPSVCQSRSNCWSLIMSFIHLSSRAILRHCYYAH